MPTKQEKIKIFNEIVKDCKKCKELVANRTQVVCNDGNPESAIMIIAEAPGRDEDVQGIPLVGKSGQLLNKILEGCGLNRQDLFITNTCLCRPPENRTPTSEETTNCRSILEIQIRIVKPKYIVCLGACAAQNLLDTKEKVGDLRKKWHDYDGMKVLVTYHPSYALRTGSVGKQHIYEDLMMLVKEMKQ